MALLNGHFPLKLCSLLSIFMYPLTTHHDFTAYNTLCEVVNWANGPVLWLRDEDEAENVISPTCTVYLCHCLGGLLWLDHVFWRNTLPAGSKCEYLCHALCHALMLQDRVTRQHKVRLQNSPDLCTPLLEDHMWTALPLRDLWPLGIPVIKDICLL